MAYFDFSRLIGKYSREFTAITRTKGSYDNKGKFQEGKKTSQTLTGAIIGFKESKIFRSSGTLTAKDKHLFMLEPISGALKGAEIIFEGEKFNIDAETENAKFTGVYAYVLKYVSAFDEGGNE